MSFLTRLLAPTRPKALDPFDDRYYTMIVGSHSLTGLYVDPETALKISAVWACARVISDPLGWLPLIMYRRQADGGRQRAEWHPLYTLLHDQPNVWQTAMEFRKLLTLYALLRGDGIARIVPGPRGPVDQLVPIHPDRVVEISQGADYQLRYKIKKSGSLVETETLLADEVFHLRFTSFDGIRGASVIAYARETMGLGLATEQYAARFFQQNATPAGLLRHPGRVDRGGRERIKAEWEADIGGLNNAHRTAVVAEGIDYTPISLSHEDAQFLQSREFGVEEVARWFGVPLHKIQHNSKTTSWGSGVEEMNQDFTSATLAPLAMAWQQTISRDLIVDTRNYFAEFLFDALNKGRLLDRYQAFHLALTDGWLNRNEVRQIENHNRADGLDEFLYAANMVENGAEESLPEPVAPTTPPPAEPEDEDEDQVVAYYHALLASDAGRVARKEIAALKTAQRRNGAYPEAQVAEMAAFYASHGAFVAQALHLPEQAAQEYAAMRCEQVSQGVTLTEADIVAALLVLLTGG
jgi:HK97 family phage portal protein